MKQLKTYKTTAGVKNGLKRAGLGAMNYTIEYVGTGWGGKVFTHDAEDANEVRSRGFMAEVNPDLAA